MSTTTHGHFCSSLAQNSSAQQQCFQNNVTPSDYVSRPEPNVQIFSAQANRDAYSNPHQAKVVESQQQNYFVSQLLPTPTLENSTLFSYGLQTAQYGYQWVGTHNQEYAQQHNYDVHARSAPVLPYYKQIVEPSQGQDSDLCNGSFTPPPGVQYLSQQLQEKLIQHEPCIHTLNKLEYDIELLKKQTAQELQEIQLLKKNCEMKDITEGILKEQLSQQERKTKILKKKCKEKDISIEMLNSEKAEDSTESEEIEEPSRNLSKTTEPLVKLNPLISSLSDIAREDIMKEVVRLRLENRDMISLQAKLCKLELSYGEHGRIEAENLSLRHEITRLERRLNMFEEASDNPSP